MAETHKVMDFFNALGIIASTFILEDPTTLAVGALIASHQMSFSVGFTSLVLGIFLGDLGLYAVGHLFKRGVFKTKKTYVRPSTIQIILARFIPGMRTLTFLASGFEGFPLKKFLLLIFPSSVIWTLLLLFFTDQVFKLLKFFPVWGNWIIGLSILLIIAKFKAIIKTLSMMLLIAVSSIHHSLISGPDKKKKLAFSLSKYCQVALRILGIEVQSELHESETHGRMILSNHMSYLDVICLSSLYPTLYVTSVEIKETPGLGLICKLCGCLFTERRRAFRKSDTSEKELHEVQSTLQQGLSLTVFPEGTSSNGEKLLPFKTMLVEGAVRAKANILPVVIRYEEIAGREISVRNRDIVCWYGKMSFLPHFLRLCNSNGIKVRILPLKILSIEDFESRKQIGAKAWELMDAAYAQRI